MARGETSGYEMEYRVKGPGEGWLHLLTYGRAVSADLKHGKFRVVGVCLDITTRKEAERLARERAKLEGVMEMAGAACHELNQPPPGPLRPGRSSGRRLPAPARDRRADPGHPETSAQVPGDHPADPEHNQV